MALRIVRRLGRFGITVVVVAVGTLIIGVAFALITVSITGTVSSNELATTTTTSTTTTTTLPPGDGLEAAVSSGGGPGPCQDAITAETMTLGSISFDLNVSAGQSYSPQAFLCVTNSQQGGGNEITTLTVEATVVSSTEDGCSDDEKTTDPDGPTVCGTAGELETVVDVLLVPAALGDPGCFSSSQVVAIGGSPVSLLQGGSGDLTGGLFCSWEVKLQLIGSATYDAKLGASTDSIGLKLDVKGSRSP